MHINSKDMKSLQVAEKINLLTADKFCQQRIEITQMPSEYLIVHIAHAFKHLKKTK